MRLFHRVVWLCQFDVDMTRPRLITAIYIGAIGFAGIATLLVVVALAIEDWVRTDGTTANNAVGELRVEHKMGVFRTHVDECCFTEGQVVPDSGTVCTMADGGCTSYWFTTGRYCRFVADKDAHTQQGHTSCREVEAGSIVDAIVILSAILAAIAVFVLSALRVFGAAGLAIAALCESLGSIAVLILTKELMYDNHTTWVRTRYQESRNLTPPTWNFALGPSYKLQAAALAFWIVSCVCAAAVWAVSRKPPPRAHVPRAEPPMVMREHIMTPRRPDAAGQSFTDFANQSPSFVDDDTLTMCPADTECPLVDEFSHQLRFTHTCRFPYCTDTSTAHRRHFLHS